MTVTSRVPVGLVALVVAMALLSPSWSGLAADSPRLSGAHCDDVRESRCPGLWASVCCDFVAPSERHDPEQLLDRVDTARIEPSPASALVASPILGAAVRTRTLDRRGRRASPPPHIVTTVLRL